MQQQQRRYCCAIKTGSQESYGSDLLRKPIVSSPSSHDDNSVQDDTENLEAENDYEKVAEGERWVDWEDQILEDTVPLVGFVRMILHSGT